jgi:hypothetical protein
MIGKRKLIAFLLGTLSKSLLGTLSKSLLVFCGNIDPGVYSVVAVALVGGFFTANVVSKLKAPA